MSSSSLDFLSRKRLEIRVSESCVARTDFASTTRTRSQTSFKSQVWSFEHLSLVSYVMSVSLSTVCPVGNCLPRDLVTCSGIPPSCSRDAVGNIYYTMCVSLTIQIDAAIHLFVCMLYCWNLELDPMECVYVHGLRSSTCLRTLMGTIISLVI